ncbi:MAG: hypothetical protein F4Z06_02270 [Acidimicrobiia bacterium]|nr:hypothetical protein [Acidimicrobiia bacterium]MYE72323.1 hypothetical protein [Acidimicrobiia bacterium]MYJ62459.1 hypothetical protein [Acidimicrobiia bacterium]
MQRLLSRENRSILPKEDTNAPKGPEGNVARWRLVNHIGSFRVEWEREKQGIAHGYKKSELQAVESIISNGDEAVKLIVSHAGLLHQPVSGAYRKYVEHHENLKMCWLSKTSQQYGDESKPFPGGPVGSSPEERRMDPNARDNDLDCAIDLDTEEIECQLEELHNSEPPRWIELSTKPRALLLAFVIAALILVGIGVHQLLWEANQDAPGILVETQSGIRCATIVDGTPQVEGLEVHHLNNAIAVDSC